MSSRRLFAHGIVGESALVHLALFTVSLMFGISYVLTKLILARVPVELWTFFRVLIAGASLLPFVLSPEVRPALKTPRLWLSGLFGTSLNQLFFAEGLKRTTPAHSSLINTSVPALTMILSLIVGRESWSLRRATGIVLAISGVAVLIGAPQPGTILGDALTFCNALSFATFLVISQPLARLYPALGLTGFFLIEGIAFMGLNLALRVLLAPDAHLIEKVAEIPLKTHLLMILVAIQSTTVTYVLNSWALRRATPSQVATYVTLQPLVAAILAALLFHDPLQTRFAPAFVLVASGVFLTAFKRRQRT